MAAQWSMDAYRHSYFIPLISFYLLWRDRERCSAVNAQGSWRGLGLLALLVAVWLIADATAIQAIEQLSIVGMVNALVIAVLGFGYYRVVWFPLAFLVFAVPIGDSMVPYLMDSTATIAVAALQSVGIPALREGMVVSLPGGTFEVVEACSGYNYLNAGVALGALISHLMFSSAWKQVIYVASMVCVFVAVNGVRAFVVMYVGSISHMTLLVGNEHVILGWVMFLVAIAIMYWIAERYSDKRRVEAPNGVD